ncbi:hypothetical protein C1H76_6694 [Elsinoe australis]|uniref:Reverse transcriptase Ty1/copia-type domain-containing protein n=1 Tax=Elsinoe australis TaxID=40998 RepID=A0A4U7AS75_9PEZI|nr:hypothetical protein C1H76_6694 [Elsinoe australis]
MPEGYAQQGKAVKVKKGLYGLKQSAALYCLYTNKERDLFVIIHIDDFQAFSPYRSKIIKLFKALNQRFPISAVKSDLFLRLKITATTDQLTITQGHYTRELLKRHGLENCKLAATPLEQLLEPTNDRVVSSRKKEYNSIISGVQYLSYNTRPDVTHATNHLARFNKNPSEEHLRAARRLLRYLASDPDKGITIHKNSKPELEAYTDSDFGGDPSTAKSTTGSLIRLGGPISWTSKLQSNVVRQLLKELDLISHIQNGKRPNVYVDNQSAISLVKNHANHKRSKHIAVRNYYCREQYDSGKIDVVYVPTTKQLADAFTKVKSPVVIR